MQTAIYADYGDYNQLTDRPTYAVDINALSHEVAEWMNDPFGSNIVPAWSSPLAPQYGCSNVLEVGALNKGWHIALRRAGGTEAAASTGGPAAYRYGSGSS